MYTLDMDREINDVDTSDALDMAWCLKVALEDITPWAPIRSFSLWTTKQGEIRWYWKFAR